MSRTIPTWADPDAPTARLLVDGRDVNTPVWVARTRRERNTGLLGTDGLDGAVWIRRCNWVHCFGMRYPIDVVYLSRSNAVTAVVCAVTSVFLILGLNHTAFYPSNFDLQSSLSISNASSSLYTLKTMFYVSFLVPFVLGYISYVWRAMDAKKLDKEGLSNEHY